jgi:predicted amidohydrolase YtcJ
VHCVRPYPRELLCRANILIPLEDIKGSMTLGKLADIVVLSRNIMTCPAEQILQTTVDHTIIGGNVVR